MRRRPELWTSAPVPLHSNPQEPPVQKSVLLRPVQQEILRHDFSYFVGEPPSMVHGGKGVVVPGCPACKKRINTMNQCLDHLAEDAMPALIEKLSAVKTE